MVKPEILIRLLIGIAALVGLQPSAVAREGIQEGFVRYYEAGEITTLLEKLSGPKNDQFFRTVITSQSSNRQGQYFVLNLKHPEQTREIEIEVISTQSKEVIRHRFTLEKSNNNAWIYLGLTGSDWPGEAVAPLAWKAVVKDSNGNALGSWESFLWSKS